MCYSLGQTRGTLWHPPSPLPRGNPGEGVSKNIFTFSKNLGKKTGFALWINNQNQYRETPSVTGCSGQGDSKKIESIRINLKDLAWSQDCPRDPGLLQLWIPGLQKSWIPGTRLGTRPGFPFKCNTPVGPRADVSSSDLVI